MLEQVLLEINALHQSTKDLGQALRSEIRDSQLELTKGIGSLVGRQSEDVRQQQGCSFVQPWSIPIAPPRVDSSKGPPRKNRQHFGIFCIFLVHGKNGLRWPQIGPGGFFPTNPDLADILGRMDFDFEICFFIFWTLNFWISRSEKSGFPDFQKSGFPGPQNLDFPTSQNLDFPASKKSTRLF